MNCEQLKQKVLSLAISGRLVEQDSNDEPASELLKRIKKEKQQLIKSGKIKKEKPLAPISPDEIPFDIPPSWQWVRLGEIFNIVTGKTPSKEHTEYYGNDYPFYKPTDLNQGKTMMNSIDNVSELGYINGVQLPKLSVLVTCIGATIGKVAINQQAGICNQQINAIKPSSIANTYYIYYVISSKFMQDIIRSTSSATTLPIMNKAKFETLLFPLPPLEEQERIVKKINMIFEEIEAIEKSKKQYNLDAKLLLQKVLSLAISGRLVEQDSNDEPASELLKRIKKEKQQLIKSGKIKKDHVYDGYEEKDDYPISWETVPLSFVCQLTKGEKKEGKEIKLDAKFLRGQKEPEYLNNGEFVRKGDDIILVDGENSGEIFLATTDGYLGSTFKYLWISNYMNKSFVKYFIILHKEELRNNKKGAAIPHLKKELFYNLSIGIPPLKEQERIVKKIEQVMPLVKELEG